MPSKCKVRQAYYSQKGSAKKRGIAFAFSYEEWCDWWKENLGPNWFQLRGCTRDKYVMARYGDVGPYEPNNVKCITHSKNNKEQVRGNYKLTVEQAREVMETYMPRSPHFGANALSAKYGVCTGTIACIVGGTRWSRLSEGAR